MQENSLGKYTWSFGVSVIITSLFSAVLVVLKESNPDTLLAWMKSMGHHWVTHGVLDIIVFLVIGLVLANTAKASEEHSVKNLTSWLVLAIIGGVAIISGFFLLEG